MITKSMYSAILNANKAVEYMEYNQLLKEIEKYFVSESFINNKDKAFKIYYFVLLCNGLNEVPIKFQSFSLKKRLIKEVS